MLRTIKVGQYVQFAVFSPNGAILATASGRIMLWNVHSGTFRAATPENKQYTGVAFEPNGTKFVASGISGTDLWDTFRAKEIGRITVGIGSSGAKYSPNGKTVALIQLPPNGVMQDDWRAVILKNLMGQPPPFCSAWKNPCKFVDDGLTEQHKCGWCRLTSIHWNVNGTLVITGRQDGTVRVWDAYTGDLKFTFFVFRNAVKSAKHTAVVDVSGDGFVLAVGHTMPNGTVHIIDLRSGAERYMLAGGIAKALKFSKDGTRIAASFLDGSTQSSAAGSISYDLIKIWDVNSGEELASFGADRSTVLSLAWNPDGKSLCSAGSATKLWDLSMLVQVGEVVSAAGRAPVSTFLCIVMLACWVYIESVEH